MVAAKSDKDSPVVAEIVLLLIAAKANTSLQDKVHQSVLGQYLAVLNFLM